MENKLKSFKWDADSAQLSYEMTDGGQFVLRNMKAESFSIEHDLRGTTETVAIAVQLEKKAQCDHQG